MNIILAIRLLIGVYLSYSVYLLGVNISFLFHPVFEVYNIHSTFNFIIWIKLEYNNWSRDPRDNRGHKYTGQYYWTKFLFIIN